MPDPSSLVIVGAGGLGREVAALVEAQNAAPWTLKGFVDDDDRLQSAMGYPVLGDVDWLSQQAEGHFAIAIGSGETRRRIYEQLTDAGVSAVRLLHPSVSVHRTTSVGVGSILCAGAAPTVNVEVGAHVVVDQHCTVGHDSVLGDFVTLHPGTTLSGAVHLETGVTMGAGSVALPGVRIGAHATVGAGAVVTEDLPAHCTASGVPAHPHS